LTCSCHQKNIVLALQFRAWHAAEFTLLNAVRLDFFVLLSDL
jgi:hypothetical protein